MRQCKSTKLLKKSILLQLLVEPEPSSMFYQLLMINQALCTLQMLGNSWHGWPLPRAHERGVQEVHCTLVREVLGPGRIKVRTPSFSVIKPKLVVYKPVVVGKLLSYK